jgi:hypothetical protein
MRVTNHRYCIALGLFATLSSLAQYLEYLRIVEQFFCMGILETLL